MRVIDADRLKEHIDKLPALPDGNFAGNHSALKALINMQPTVEPERKPGKWIDGKCNKCGANAPFWPMATTYYCSEYCPKCGAQMEVDG